MVTPHHSHYPSRAQPKPNLHPQHTFKTVVQQSVGSERKIIKVVSTEFSSLGEGSPFLPGGVEGEEHAFYGPMEWQFNPQLQLAGNHRIIT